MLALALASCGGGGATSGGDGPPNTGGISWVNKNYGPPDSSFIVQNDWSADRTEIAMASVPFGPGQVKDLAQVGIVGKETCWRALHRWPDGSVKIAQAQFVDTFKAKSKQSYRVTTDGSGTTAPFAPHPWTASKIDSFVMIPKVIDDDGVPYFGLISGPGEVRSETKLSRTRFWRTYLYNSNSQLGIKRDFLTARFYITEYRDMPFLSVEFVIGNDYQGADNPTSNDKNLRPLGAVSFQKLELHLIGGWARLHNRSQQWVDWPTWDDVNRTEVWTLLENTHLDDGQTKMYHFEVYLEEPSASQAERNRWRSSWEALSDAPLRALATYETWRHTDALGLCGGPAGRPDEAWSWAEGQYNGWLGRNHFGPFGSWGDPKNTHTTGTPRNHPVSPQLARAIQGENPRLLHMLEGMATQQACRQYHLWDIEIAQDRDIYLWFGLRFNLRGTQTYTRDHLGRYDFHVDYKARDPYTNWRRNVPSKPGHGWNPVDAEHATVDLVFDYHAVTGSHWALDEIKMLGQYVRGIWRFQDYWSAKPISARAEGWVLQLLTACYVATGNEDFKADVIRRIDEVTNKFRHVDHPSRAMFFERNYPSTKYPGDNRFIVPWQHAAVAIGFVSAFRFCGSRTALDIAEDSIRTAEYAMVRNFTDPVSKTFHEWNMRFYIPVSFTGTYKGKSYTDFMTPKDFFDADPAVGVRLGGGVPEFWKSATFLVARYSGDANIQTLAVDIGDRVMGEYKADGSHWWNKWAVSVPTELLPANRITN